MEITKEQIKRLAKAVKAMQEETLIDDDVTGGYQPDPFKDAYAEIYQVIDECERGDGLCHEGTATLPIHVSFDKRKVCRCYEVQPKKYSDKCDTCGRVYI